MTQAVTGAVNVVTLDYTPDAAGTVYSALSDVTTEMKTNCCDSQGTLCTETSRKVTWRDRRPVYATTPATIELITGVTSTIAIT